VKLNAGIPMYFDNSLSKKNLKIMYRPINETITEHFQQMIDDGLVEKR
jgi:dihydroflavonol-4-reductase